MAPTKKICSISIDLDPLTAYYEIHGLGDPPPSVRYTILRKALPRFEEMLREAGVPATFFVVGRDLCRSESGAATLRRLVEEQGCELANHTFTHPYDLNRLPQQVIDSEVRQGHDALVNLVGLEHRPVGFRSPGYGIGPKVMEVLANQAYRYDSSMMPSPPYYLAKGAVMAGMFMRGRSSGSVMGDPRFLSCPSEPYRPDVERPWRRGNGPLVEMPVAVLPISRVPVIGTLFAVSSEPVRRFLLRAIARRSFFNFELHGIDLSDAIEDRIPTELAGRQPDLRVPFPEKRERFLRTIQQLKKDHTFMTLGDAAVIVQREGRIG